MGVVAAVRTGADRTDCSPGLLDERSHAGSDCSGDQLIRSRTASPKVTDGVFRIGCIFDKVNLVDCIGKNCRVFSGHASITAGPFLLPIPRPLLGMFGTESGQRLNSAELACSTDRSRADDWGTPFSRCMQYCVEQQIGCSALLWPLTS
jgi:hypothetical protein